VTAQQDAERILKRFNSSRREAEKERQLVKAWEVADADQPLKHQWGKLSLVTEKGGFDRMQCEICGVTGKRYSLGGNVQIDAKYKKKYEHMCPAKRIN
jgi:hypothetical protein